MKQSVWLCLILLCACTGGSNAPAHRQVTRVELTRTEEELVRQIGFDAEVVRRFKQYASAEVRRLNSMQDELGDIAPSLGVECAYPRAMENAWVIQVREEFEADGYQVFRSDFGKVAMIKGADSFAIVRHRRTDGINHGLSHEAVLKRLKQWDERYGLIIIGADFDWVEARFKTQPQSMQSFADEVYKFCPDVVDPHTGGVAALANQMKTKNSVYLWWD